MRTSSTDVVRGVALREVEEVGGVGAGEGVDRLRRVADDAQVVAAAEPQVEQCRLDRADVLELVDDEPFVLLADLGRDPLVLGEQRGRAEQDVLHVHPALVALDVLVGREHVGDRGRVDAVDRAAARLGEPRVVVGPDVADLGPLDLGGEVAQGRLVGLDAVAPGGVADEAQLGLGEHRQVAAVDPRPEEPGLAQRRGVERAGLHPAGAQAAQPGAHLAGGAGGERDRQHLGGVVDPRRHAVGDPVRDRPGLAGAGARQHPHRAPQRLRDLPLLGVERVQQLVGARREGCDRRHQGMISSHRAFR